MGMCLEIKLCSVSVHNISKHQASVKPRTKRFDTTLDRIDGMSDNSSAYVGYACIALSDIVAHFIDSE